jgi:hypothetical protein
MPAPVIIAGAALAVAAVGTAATISAQNKAAKAEQRKFQYEKALNNNRGVRERRDAIRAARLTTGQLTQAAENQGASGTSASLGGLGSIQTQLNGNLSFLDGQTKLAGAAGEAGSQARTAANSANNWAAVSQLGMSVFSIASGRIK